MIFKQYDIINHIEDATVTDNICLLWKFRSFSQDPCSFLGLIWIWDTNYSNYRRFSIWNFSTFLQIFLHCLKMVQNHGKFSHSRKTKIMSCCSWWVINYRQFILTMTFVFLLLFLSEFLDDKNDTHLYMKWAEYRKNKL